MTTTTLVQNVSAPTTIVTDSVSHEVKIDPPLTASPFDDPWAAPKTAAIARAEKTREASPPNVNVESPPAQAPGTYLGPNVEIGPGVTFGGNVYVQGDLVIGGTRQHPVLTTR